MRPDIEEHKQRDMPRRSRMLERRINICDRTQREAHTSKAELLSREELYVAAACVCAATRSISLQTAELRVACRQLRAGGGFSIGQTVAVCHSSESC